jgi:flagellar protein FlbD
MIKLTHLSHESFVLNADLIEQLESTPDTVITLTTGQKLRVSESADEIIARVVEFRRSVLERPCPCPLPSRDVNNGS